MSSFANIGVFCGEFEGVRSFWIWGQVFLGADDCGTIQECTRLRCCSMACKDRSKRWQWMCWRLCEIGFEFERRVDGWMQGVSGMCEVETDFRNLRMNVRFDGRKKEIRSRSSCERDDYECGCVWKSRFEFFLYVFTFGLEICR